MKPEKDWSKRYSDFLRLGKYNFNVSRTPKRPSKSSKVPMSTRTWIPQLESVFTRESILNCFVNAFNTAKKN